MLTFIKLSSLCFQLLHINWVMNDTLFILLQCTLTSTMFIMLLIDLGTDLPYTSNIWYLLPFVFQFQTGNMGTNTAPDLLPPAVVATTDEMVPAGDSVKKREMISYQSADGSINNKLPPINGNAAAGGQGCTWLFFFFLQCSVYLEL